MDEQDTEQKKGSAGQTACPVRDETRREEVLPRLRHGGPAVADWNRDGSEEIVAALRAFFLTHALDPLTGEIHIVQ